MPRSPDIALITDAVDWHARALTRAFARLGVRARAVALPACVIDTTSPLGLAIPGFDRLPDAVLVRSLSGGSFEAVTLRLGILHALRERGVPVWNDARAIERCVDKSMTSFLLARAGIPTPQTWATESIGVARDIARREAAHGPLVLKPLFGSQGRGLRLIHAEDDLPAAADVAGVYYLQRFVGARAPGAVAPAERGGFQDFRLFVSHGRVIAAMARHAASWITNVKQGGRPVPAVADAESRDLAVRAADAVGACFAGVDILHGADGAPLVLEVNSMPAWSGLQKVTPVRIAAMLAGDLVAALRAGTPPRASAPSASAPSEVAV
jgi:tetrahydromethanopterin:alpha-L-glutamate ligase